MGCVEGVCGRGAECEDVGGRPVCKCLPGHHGNPYTGCIAGECDENSDCGPQRACKDYKCVDPCQISCGQGADCTVQNHVAICRCPATYIGNPLQGCRHECERDSECGPTQKCDRQNYRCENACSRGACGENANCQAVNNRAKCTCPP